ncbi:hypothetical protein DENIS_0501 [Desulfonema ishimotonii]|uniref:UspA domain-containing protein n=1 Tax=Desulfonema ishimotonii TaxID=45657 RepID=A0A401FRG6_9BACT|nr:universal stress protein [Desulfonema ishimotonii]GBC59562.1 hypothetical protein DENIS_0501 [Desulfonema ishimotonii]
MKKSILVALKDSESFNVVMAYVEALPLRFEALSITLCHVFRQPTASEALMGEDFIQKDFNRIRDMLQRAKERLVEAGFGEDQVVTELETTPYTTIAEGIISRFEKEKFDMVIIGRRKKSKSEEFVLGDVSVKLVRDLEKTAVLVIKSDAL